MNRISKEEYYLGIAKAVSARSTCLTKHWGAVIVKDDQIISCGFNGAPRGCEDCLERGFCRLTDYRRKAKLGRGTGYEQCLSVHAELNAIIFADKDKLVGSALFLYGEENTSFDGTLSIVKNAMPCTSCRKAIINAGIRHVIVKTDVGFICYVVDDWKNVESITGGY